MTAVNPAVPGGPLESVLQRKCKSGAGRRTPQRPQRAAGSRVRIRQTRTPSTYNSRPRKIQLAARTRTTTPTMPRENYMSQNAPLRAPAQWVPATSECAPLLAPAQWARAAWVGAPLVAHAFWAGRPSSGRDVGHLAESAWPRAGSRYELT